jgi:photosystem II stability/assembly factor-like uncharacterized protein
MRPRGAWRLLLAALWARPLDAKEPALSVTKLKHSPDFLSYFEDSDVILFQDIDAGVIYRSGDAGASWGQVEDVPAGKAARLIMHEYDSNRAYVMTEGLTHYRTHDRGKSWHTFFVDSRMSVFQFEPLMFHAGDPDRILFNGMDCENIFCDEETLYTTDGFTSDAKFLRAGTAGCWWAKSSRLFSTGQDDLDSQRILCIVEDDISPFKQDQRLLVSDNYFSASRSDGVIQEFEPNMDMNRPVKGVVNIAVVKKYLMVATTSLNTDEMALFVTDDTLKWHRAIFPEDHKINQEAYTVLESTNYSIQIDVMNTKPSNPMGVMFTSNSNGTYFTRNMDYTNRNSHGHVDFEKISGIQGIFLVNRVANGDEVSASARKDKKVVTEITFDDGRTFSDIFANKKRIHLHSVTELNNVGRVFSSPAPGLVMGVGNTGDYLKPFDDGDLYVSDDAGVTWSLALEGPHKYEFGDSGSVLVAVKNGDKVGEIRWSLNHGKKWESTPLPDDLKFQPWILTTTQDSTSLKFVLVGLTGDQFYVVAIDFGGLHESTCKDSDMEDWWARVDDKGEPTCLMGHTQKYHRRKKDAECFLKQDFKDPVVETTDCDCTDQDFECDYNFRRDGDKCERVGQIALPEGACKNPGDKFMGSNGWRLIPGNTCKRTGGEQKDKLVEHDCSKSTSPPSAPMTGKVSHTKVVDFKGDGISEFINFDIYYLERGDSSSKNEETVIARPIDERSGGYIYFTHDHGKKWQAPDIFKEKKNFIWEIIPHQFFKEMVFFVTRKGKVIYTWDYGKSFHEFEAPNPPSTDAGAPLPLTFHPDKKDWLIWVGEKCEEDKTCFLEASYSKDRGDNWNTLMRYVERCEFIGSSAMKGREKQQILCLTHEREDGGKDNRLVLKSSPDWFEDDIVTLSGDVKNFATMAEFIVVAAEDTEKSSLKALASMDGKTYAKAEFPYNFEVPHQHGYTVLDSSTHAVNLFVETETKQGHKYGAIIKSNSNGTIYVMSMNGVNCNDELFVDFEKMLGLEGVVLVNVVTNRDDLSGDKQLQTKISHNDGALWAFLPPPQKDVDGKDYSCRSGSGDENCALHIHGYTERRDHRKTFSSEGAVGIMFGLGNVGRHLGSWDEADTFMTTDAGITWKNVKKGAWDWQIGDQGSIIVLKKRSISGSKKEKMNTISFSVDEGATWTDYQFSDEEVEVLDLTTLRSGASRNFLLWCRKGSEVFTINLDFSGLTDRACDEYDPKDPGKSDYYLWSPRHPLSKQDCLFGHQTQYKRKKTDRTCYNGYKIDHLYNTVPCECDRQDFEW